jgi:hypothetical protein
MANQIVDAAMTYALMKRLVTPFEKWPAYDLGIIDEKGKVLRPRRTLNADEKKAWGRFDILAANIKKIIQKLPGGQTRLVSLAAAAFLFKEGIDVSSPEALESSLAEYVMEDGVAANAVGGGAIAGLGVGDQGEPPMSKNAQLKHIRSVIKRRKNVAA